jgi:hypothetical protein
MEISKLRELGCESRPRTGGSSSRPSGDICSFRVAVLVWALASALLWSAVVALWRMA